MTSSHRTNFLSLPRELRNQIYDLALISSQPVVVWSSYVKLSWPPEQWDSSYDVPMRWVRSHIVDHQATVSSVQDLALNLPRCDSTMAREGAMTFYGKNTFCFFGDHNWDPIVSWLQAIGAENRGHLTKLEARARRPENSSQQRAGTRTKRRNYHEELELYQRSPHLYRSPESTKEGFVENINDAAIKTIFAILASDHNAPKLTLTLTLRLDWEFIPGVQLGITEQHQDVTWFSMDLPDLIEKLRYHYAANPQSARPMEVVWKGVGRRHEFIKQRILIQERAWQIVEAIEAENCRTCTFSPTEYGSISTMQFILKSRELKRPPVADHPSPYSC
ncbi:hypothetical protein MMC16_006927 [Acarospora aff. strigata]|nr:hypothetical protein [Acarospora aff. strigata]